MPGYDLLRIADGSQIYARIPAQQQIKIEAELLQHPGGEFGIAGERAQQFGNAGGIHSRLLGEIKIPARGVFLRRTEEAFHFSHIGSAAVFGQAIEKHAPVLLLQNAIVEQAEQPAIVQGADQPAKALLQRNHRAGHLILVEGVAAVVVNGADARGHHGIVRDREGQLVNDDAA